MDWRSHITITPGMRSGQPCIRGMRIAVADVLDQLASGLTIEDLIRDFPDLTKDDVLACLSYAAARERLLTDIGS